jgi:hypothetical protein
MRKWTSGVSKSSDIPRMIIYMIIIDNCSPSCTAASDGQSVTLADERSGGRTRDLFAVPSDDNPVHHHKITPGRFLRGSPVDSPVTDPLWRAGRPGGATTSGQAGHTNIAAASRHHARNAIRPLAILGLSPP